MEFNVIKEGQNKKRGKEVDFERLCHRIVEL